jgi:hypothetical protein
VSYSSRQYRDDLAIGLLMALGLTLIAAIPLAIAGVLNLAALLRHRPLEVPWLAYLAMWVVVPGSYFVAALVGATAAFLLRPLRNSLLGWTLTGAVLAAIIYGSVGLALAIFFNPVGAIVLEHSTREEAWESIPGFVAILSPVGALVGTYIGWRDRRGKPLW